MSKTNSTPTTDPRPNLRTLSLALVAVAGFAVPAVAFASNGADDPAGHDAGTTTATTGTTTASGTTGTTGAAPAPSTARAKAVAAARARVGADTTLVRVVRKSQGRSSRAVAWEVRLKDGTFRYTVRLNRSFGVLRVKKERLRAASTTTTSTGTTSTPTTSTPTPDDHGGTRTGGSDDPVGHDAGDDRGGHGGDD